MASYNDQDKRKISRREFLHLTAITVAGFVAMGHDAISSPAAVGAAAACSSTESSSGQSGLSACAQSYNEAPMLAKLVQQGRLPPVDKRLPTNPCIIPALDQTGEYDNLMNRAFKDVSDRWGPTKMIDRMFVWYDKDLNLVPRLCESWQANDDASEWTFHLRQGTKWSDGVEFTSDDIMWWYQNELTDNRIFSSPFSKWTAGGEVMTVQAPDRYTVKMRFDQPNVLFVYQLTRGSASYSCLCPSHHMQRYHIDFTDNPAALEAEAAAAGFSSWGDYYRDDRNWWYLNPDRPDLGPWLAKNKLTESLFVMERNPYYYCVDIDDNQLPYVDIVTHCLFTTDAEFNTWIKSGAIDFQARHVNFAYYDELKASESAGGYQVVLGVKADHVAIQLNLTTTSSTRLREFFQDTRVRKALSLAVDRAYLNTQFYNGLATPRQYSPLSTSPQYYATLSNAYITYDVIQANTLLDDAGYTEKDGEGFRLWKDGSGERVSFTIKGTAQAGSAEEQAVQRVIQYYAAVGVEVTYQCLDRTTYEGHCWSNQIEAAWGGGNRTVLPVIAPHIFLGTLLEFPWACAWGMWRNDPTNPVAEEPPTGHWIRDIWNKWEQIEVQSDQTQRNSLFRDILDIWATELPMIGYLGECPVPVIVKNGLHNYDAGYPLDDSTADEHLLNPETYYWDSPLVPALSINYASGSPGSFFTLTGVNYPPNSTAMIAINGHVIHTLFTNPAGNIEFVLDTSQADIGYYEVTVSVNPSASTMFELAQNEPQRPQESSAPELDVPEGIAITKVYLPLIQR